MTDVGAGVLGPSLWRRRTATDCGFQCDEGRGRFCTRVMSITAAIQLSTYDFLNPAAAAKQSAAAALPDFSAVGAAPPTGVQPLGTDKGRAP